MEWLFNNWMELAGLLIALATLIVARRQNSKKQDRVIEHTSKTYKQPSGYKSASVNDKFCHLIKFWGNRLLIVLLIGGGFVTCSQGVPYAENNDKPEVMWIVLLVTIVVALICTYLFIWDRHNKDKFKKEVRPVEDAATAFDEGYDAYIADIKKAANPYRHGTTKRDEWLDGWQEGLNHDSESNY